MNNRMNIPQSLEPHEVLYAVGQGALAVECRSSDEKILQMLGKLCCLQTQCRILAERSFLKTLGGGCSAPVAVQTILSKTENTNEVPNSDYQLEIKGGVWSLDGQTEILGVEKCLLNLSCSKKRNANDMDIDTVIKKRPRLSDNEQMNEFSPPKIIAHSNLSNKTDTNDNSELAELVHIHEDAFKKCPYSSILSNALAIPTAAANESTNEPNARSETENHTVPQVKCPVHFPVGQDVMGQCPYFDTTDEQKLKEFTKIQGSGSVQTGVGSATKELKCPFSGLNAQPSPGAKCPFSSRTSNANATSVSDKVAEVNPSQSKCPYLSNAVVDDGFTTKSNETTRTPSVDVVPLFCGLYRHACYPLEIFSTCEAIGKNLAEQLITEGAHKVMEVAQREIRQGTPAAK